MPVELRFGPDLSQTLQDSSAGLRREADFYQAKADSFFRIHPDARNIPEPEHTDGATYERLAQVLRRYAGPVDGLFLNLQRDLVRASNPYFANYSDAHIDLIISVDKETATLQERHRKMRSRP